MAQNQVSENFERDPNNMILNLFPISTFILPTDTSFMVMGQYRFSPEAVRTVININGLIGKGTFGHVYKATLDQSERPVAIKQVQLNPVYLKREADIMNHVAGHCNIVNLIMHCYAKINNAQNTYMLMAMEYMPMTLLDYIKTQEPHGVPLIYIRILTYQLFRGMAHLHSYDICHRDIKPNNILMDSATMSLKLADFGSAKFLELNQFNDSYVCSRFYRAPELFAMINPYTTTVDMWSAGCVVYELFKGTPLFVSNKHEQVQLQYIIQKLGTDGLDLAPKILSASGLTSIEYIPRYNWQTSEGEPIPQDFAELLNRCLIYDHTARISALRACAHICYDELRTMDALKTPMPNGSELPPLFNFSHNELNAEPGLWVDLLPMRLAQNGMI